MEENFYEFMGWSSGRSARDLLENFELVGFGHYSALIPKDDFNTNLRANVEAALLATNFDIGLDYAKKKYGSKHQKNINDEKKVILRNAQRYIECYLISKYYVESMISKVSSAPEGAERLGSFGAAAALVRLQYSFFSAHILYELGHQYEGHAVSRLILEQIAWAYSAYELDNIDAIKKLVTTKCIGKLNELIPTCGRFYNELSNGVHIDYKNHADFLRIKDGTGVILFTHTDFAQYGFIMLRLADLFGIVWEISQAPHIFDFEATMIKNGICIVNKDRPFIKIANERLAEFEIDEKETTI
ncbi:MAG: hypothetical protein WAZ19_06745 [Anaerolineae bacterium]